jgi:hypothetical protein
VTSSGAAGQKWMVNRVVPCQTVLLHTDHSKLLTPTCIPYRRTCWDCRLEMNKQAGTLSGIAFKRSCSSAQVLLPYQNDDVACESSFYQTHWLDACSAVNASCCLSRLDHAVSRGTRLLIFLETEEICRCLRDIVQSWRTVWTL